MIIDQEFCRYDPRTGSLFIDLLSGMGKGFLFRLDSWRRGFSLRQFHKGTWIPGEEAFDFPFLSQEMTALGPCHPVNMFTAAIPEVIRKIVEPIRYQQLMILYLLRHHQAAHDIIQSQPAILWLVCNHIFGKHMTREEVNDFLGLRRVQMLREAFGYGTKSTLKLLSKLSGLTYEVYDYPFLEAFIRNEALQCHCRHLSKINWEVLKQALKMPKLLGIQATFPLLSGGNESIKYLSSLRQLINDIKQLGCSLGFKDTERIIRGIGTADQLQTLHERWTSRLNNQEELNFIRRYGETLPTPPLPGDGNIQPLDTVREIFREGKTMHHCVAGYVDRVRKGKCYIYRMLHPQRGTIEIIGNQQIGYSIAQFRLACNASPSNEAWKFAKAWIKMVQNRGKHMPLSEAVNV